MTIERLKAIRKAFGETQAEFAKRIGVSLDTVKKWETGAPIPLIACKLLDRVELEPKALKRDNLQTA